MLLVLVGGCGSPRKLSPSDYYGTWTVDYGFAYEELYFKPNGSFEQRLHVRKTGAKNTVNGSWWTTSVDNKTTIVKVDSPPYMVVVDGFGFFNPDYDKIRLNPGQASLTVGHDIKGMYLVYSEEFKLRKKP